MLLLQPVRMLLRMLMLMLMLMLLILPCRMRASLRLDG